MPPFKVGDYVVKKPKPYGAMKTLRTIRGEVRSVYTNCVGQLRLVVEENDGATHIYDPASVELAQR